MIKRAREISTTALAALALASIAPVTHANPIDTGQKLDKHYSWKSSRSGGKSAPQPAATPNPTAQAEIFCHTGSPPPCPPSTTETGNQQSATVPAKPIEPLVQVNRPKPQ